MLRKFPVLALLMVLALVSGGWSPPAAGQVPDPGRPATVDDLLTRVTQQVPGFGGMFLQGDVLEVQLVDPGQRGPAERAIQAVFGPGAIPAGGVEVVPARFSFRQLKGWQGQADSLLDLVGVVFTDADEAANRVRIGIESAELAGRVDAELRRMGVPADAVEVVVTEPVVQLASLQDRVRPLQGGLQINFPGYLCTYGFNATRAGVAGFVTNSHCTTKQGGVESTQYWQNLQSIDPTSIGTEIADPIYSKSNCPRNIRGKVCRQSDSAFVRLSTTDYVRGRIAQTTGPNNNSLAISGYFSISGEGSAVVGNTVSKVGRTTGWSQGRVTNVCVNTGVSGSNIVQLCQTFVTAAVNSGDSGSPAFIASGSNATLVGILWGGSGSSFVYSPIANIEAELGALTTN